MLGSSGFTATADTRAVAWMACSCQRATPTCPCLSTVKVVWLCPDPSQHLQGGQRSSKLELDSDPATPSHAGDAGVGELYPSEWASGLAGMLGRAGGGIMETGLALRLVGTIMVERVWSCWVGAKAWGSCRR